MTDRRAVTGGVLVDDDGPVRVVTIDRPERRNAVDSVAAAALLEAFVEFDADDVAVSRRADRGRRLLLRRCGPPRLVRR